MKHGEGLVKKVQKTNVVRTMADKTPDPACCSIRLRPGQGLRAEVVQGRAIIISELVDASPHEGFLRQ